MRKFFTLIACVAIALPFAACSSDNDDNGNEEPTPGSTNIVKSITSIMNDDGKTETYIINFEYDSNDRLTKISSSGDNSYSYYTFGYVGSSIVTTTDEDDEYEGQLLNGRVVNGKCNDSERTYTVNYDGNGYLQYVAKEFSDGRKNTVNLTWNGGNITQTYSGRDYYKFMETTILNNANIDLSILTSICYEDMLYELYCFALIRKTGTACKNIILDAETGDTSIPQSYTYKTNTNGYPSEIHYNIGTNAETTLVITYK